MRDCVKFARHAEVRPSAWPKRLFCAILFPMLNARRVLAFSGRIQTYLLLIYSFVVAIHGFGLYHPFEDRYLVLIQAALEALTWLHFTYGAVLVLMALSIGFKDRVFPAKDFLLIIVKLAVVVVAVLALRFIDSVINHGFIIRV